MSRCSSCGAWLQRCKLLVMPAFSQYVLLHLSLKTRAYTPGFGSGAQASPWLGSKLATAKRSGCLPRGKALSRMRPASVRSCHRRFPLAAEEALPEYPSTRQLFYQTMLPSMFCCLVGHSFWSSCWIFTKHRCCTLASKECREGSGEWTWRRKRGKVGLAAGRACHVLSMACAAMRRILCNSKRYVPQCCGGSHWLPLMQQGKSSSWPSAHQSAVRLASLSF